MRNVLLVSRIIAVSLCLTAQVVADSPGSTPAPANAAPPEAVVLFDGRSHEAWVSQKARQWENSDGPADWKILKDGSLEVVPGTGSLITKQKLRDIKLHFEYSLTDGKTNGRVFLMARYELGIRNGEANGNDLKYGCAFENLEKPVRPA